MAAARHHGVQFLLAHRISHDAHLASQGAPPWALQWAFGWPVAFLDELRRNFRDSVVKEMIVRRELSHVLASLAAGGVRPLLFKGAALAFTHYPAPPTRPRVDADLLIVPAEVQAATGILERLGYRHR